MKIGILTFHRAYNYGARLQCYALSSYLRSLGQNVKVIDYYPDYFRDEYGVFPLKRIRQAPFLSKLAILLESLLHLPLNIIRRNKFDQFLSLIPLSQSLSSSSSHYGDYDIVFVGSDQVWNRHLTGNRLDIFYTGGVPHKGIKLVSYAASTNFDASIVNQTSYYFNILNNFDVVTVREDPFRDYCNNLVPGSTITVADPILLLDKDDWKKIAKKPKIKHQYVLVYTVPSNASVMQLAKMVAKANNWDIIELVPSVKYIYRKYARQIASPQEFVGFFMYASYVVTTSFHGTAFSINFEKQFSTVLLNNAVDERALSLLNRLNLKSRAVSSNSIGLPESDIDYVKTNILLNDFRLQSRQFIKDQVN